MGRQTGYECAKCHTVFPELTPFGRQFKIGAFAMRSEKWDAKPWIERLPVSAALLVSRSDTSDTRAGGTTKDDFPKDGKVVAQTVASYYGGKIVDNAGALPNYFTINGRSYPATDTVKMRVGETIKLRFIGTNNNVIHPMHVHGGPFIVVARDGVALEQAARFVADTINVGPGQRYDVIWTAREPGKWLVHYHIPHHTTNNNQEPNGGGGLLLLDVSG